MANNNGGSLFREFEYQSRDVSLGLRIECRRRFIEDKQIRFTYMRHCARDSTVSRARAGDVAEHIGRTLLQLPLPFRELIRVHIEWVRQFHQRSLSLDRP